MIHFFKQFFFYNEKEPLIFTQVFFWVFFACVLFFYSFLYNKKVLRNLYLLSISLFFYYKTGGFFFFLLLFSTIVDYTLGMSIYISKKKWQKGVLLFLSILINLVVLSYFKYTDFFVKWLNYFTGFQVVAKDYLAILSNNIWGTNFNIQNIILPIGISFYTFQTMSYSIDIFRGKVKPVMNIFDFGFYVSFFPQLVAGPIVRASSFIPQLYKKYSLTSEEAGYALFLIINGIIKKIVISDMLAVNFIDRIFADPLSYTGFENLIGIYAYSLQIYCDFSGYTDIALGVALILGFNLPINFNFPYKAIGLKDFWQRWHISLSAWLKDYLYISLGGSRKGKIRTYINLLITMLIGGLWHGASIRFIVWGAIHGVGLVINKLWLNILPTNITQNKNYKFISWFLTFNFVSFAWIPFRAENMQIVEQMFYQIIMRFNIISIANTLTIYRQVIFILFIGYFIHWVPTGIKESIKFYFITSNYWIKAIVSVIILFVLYHIRSVDFQPFIYFQF